METDIDPLYWGWRMANNKMVPIMTDEVSFLGRTKKYTCYVTSYMSQRLFFFRE